MERYVFDDFVWLRSFQSHQRTIVEESYRPFAVLRCPSFEFAA